ncbi:MAG: DUF167 domain-containing protein [Novosphingobium sp.]|nr:DUF167 domain-containing protein [Novosphingobium sp.]
MAKPRAELPPAEAIRALASPEGRLALRVTPGARTESAEISGGRLFIKVRAKASDGEANAAVLALLSTALGVPRSQLQLLRGATSREKLVQIAD